MKVTGVACKSGAIFPVILNASSSKCPLLKEKVELDDDLHLMVPTPRLSWPLSFPDPGRGGSLQRLQCEHKSHIKLLAELQPASVQVSGVRSWNPRGLSSYPCVLATSRPVGAESHASELQLSMVPLWGLSPFLTSFWVVLTRLGYGLPFEKQGVKGRPDADAVLTSPHRGVSKGFLCLRTVWYQ